MGALGRRACAQRLRLWRVASERCEMAARAQIARRVAS